MRVQLANGLIVEGTESQVINAARALNQPNPFEDGRHYNSSTHGYILIADMDSRHIRNAAAKIYREFAEKLTQNKDNASFIEQVRVGPKTNVTLLALLAELKDRVNRGVA